MRLRLSKRWLRRLAAAVLTIAALAGLYFLGKDLSPRDAGGRPLIYSPSVRAAENYRRRAQGWAEELAVLDQRLAALLRAGEITDAAQLYELSDEAEGLVDRATDVAQDVAFTPAPTAMAGLAQQSEQAASAYLEAALAAARWVGAPQRDSLRAALEALRAARAARADLEASQWIR